MWVWSNIEWVPVSLKYFVIQWQCALNTILLHGIQHYFMCILHLFISLCNYVWNFHKLILNFGYASMMMTGLLHPWKLGTMPVLKLNMILGCYSMVKCVVQVSQNKHIFSLVVYQMVWCRPTDLGYHLYNTVLQAPYFNLKYLENFDNKAQIFLAQISLWQSPSIQWNVYNI